MSTKYPDLKLGAYGRINQDELWNVRSSYDSFVEVCSALTFLATLFLFIFQVIR